MISWLMSNLLWTQGRTIFLAIVVAAVVGFFIFKPILYIAVVGFLFSFYFFRNPVRVCSEAQNDSSVLICPADGKVVGIEKVENDPNFTQKVMIFLSPFDVHVNWHPFSGTVQEVKYHKGQFVCAFLPKSSELNERNDVLFKKSSGTLVKVRQISGTIARVIVCWVRVGETVNAGDTFGMIKFGSRVEVFLPSGAEISVQKGERVFGGATVLGKLQ
jgi:phosphatidylserine decarboxylase